MYLSDERPDEGSLRPRKPTHLHLRNHPERSDGPLQRGQRHCLGRRHHHQHRHDPLARLENHPLGRIQRPAHPQTGRTRQTPDVFRADRERERVLGGDKGEGGGGAGVVERGVWVISVSNGILF